jgi:hypothetical protein
LTSLPNPIELTNDDNPVEQLLLAINPRKNTNGEKNLEYIKEESEVFYREKHSIEHVSKDDHLSSAEKNEYKGASSLKKCWLLFMRSFSNTARDKRLFFLYIFQQVFSLAFCCYIYVKLHRDYDNPTDDQFSNIKNRIGSFFFICMSIYIAALMNSSLKIVQEINIVYKEIQTGLYDPWNYYWTKSLIDLLILAPLIFTVTTLVLCIDSVLFLA